MTCADSLRRTTRFYHARAGIASGQPHRVMDSQIILDAIREKVEELHKSVKEYESDTFSASASELTDAEALTITANIIKWQLQRLIDTETMDGVLLSEELENIRPDED